MPLKKPSEYFSKNKLSGLSGLIDQQREEIVPKVAVKASSTMLTDTFENFKKNVDKVDQLSATVQDIREDIKGLLSQEDLDSAMMAHLLTVEESVKGIQGKVEGINAKTLVKIKGDFSSLTEVVNNFLDIELPKYRKLILDSKSNIDDRFNSHKESVHQWEEAVEDKLVEFDENIDNRFVEMKNTLKGINNGDLSQVRRDIKGAHISIENVLNDQSDHKKFIGNVTQSLEQKIVDSNQVIDQKFEKVEEEFDRVEKEFGAYLTEHDKVYDEWNTKCTDFIKEEVSKFETDLSEKVVKLELDLLKSDKKSQETYSELNEHYKVAKKDISNALKNLKKESKSSSTLLSTTRNQLNEKIDTILPTLDNKIDNLSGTLQELVDQRVQEVKQNLNEINNEKVKSIDDKFKSHLAKSELALVEFDENIDNRFAEIRNDLNGINTNAVDDIAKYQQESTKRLDNKADDIVKYQLESRKRLDAKIAHLENLIKNFKPEKFDEVLAENAIKGAAQGVDWSGDPNTSTTDPLTPLAKNFVTLDQLQSHYKLFINRIQQQLYTIGGGGAGFIKDLDDVDISGIADSYILSYDASNSKWKTIANSGGGTWDSDGVGISTTKKVGVGTTARSDYALYVEGNQYVDGNITVGGTITYEDVTSVDSIGIVTARAGVHIPTDSTNLQIGAGNDLKLYHDGTNSYIVNTTGTLRIDPKSGERGIILTGDGSVDLYYDNSKVAETVSGGFTVTGTASATDFNTTSDAKLKTNIKIIEDPITKILKIEGVSFNWKSDNKPSLGVIADQLQTVLPELVSDGDPKAVNYNGLIGLLIEVVKDQQNQIDELKEEFNKYKKA